MFHLDRENMDSADLSEPFTATQLKFLVMDTHFDYEEQMKYTLHILGFPAVQFQKRKFYH